MSALELKRGRLFLLHWVSYGVTGLKESSCTNFYLNSFHVRFLESIERSSCY
jgi:hypothetical protein